MAPEHPDDPLAVLRDRIQRLHRTTGEPSTRDIAHRTGGTFSHTTVHAVLRCQKVPRWGQLELVVEALGGSTDEFRQLWIAVRDSEDDQRVKTRGGPAALRNGSSGDLNDITDLPTGAAGIMLSNEFRRLHSEAGRPTESEIVELAKDVVVDVATVVSVLRARTELAGLGAHEVIATALGADAGELAGIRRLWVKAMQDQVVLKRLVAKSHLKAEDDEVGVMEQPNFAGSDFRPLVVASTYLRGFDLVDMPFHVVQKGYARKEVNEHLRKFGRWVSCGMMGDAPVCPNFSLEHSGYDPAEVCSYFYRLEALQTRSPFGH